MPPIISQVQERYLSNDPIAKYVKEELKTMLVSLNTCIPGVVQKYNPKNNRAVILPIFKIKLAEDIELPSGEVTDEYPVPPISNVPVLFLGGANMRISFDLKEKDRGILLFSQRSLEQWKRFLQSNTPPKQHYPKINRKFNINDGVFFPSVIDKFPTASLANITGDGGKSILEQAVPQITGLGALTEQAGPLANQVNGLNERLRTQENALEDLKERFARGTATQGQINRQTELVNGTKRQIGQIGGQLREVQGSITTASDNLFNSLNSQVGSAVNDLGGEISSLFSGFASLPSKSGDDTIGGSKINWDGPLAMGNKQMKVLDAYNDLHDEIMSLTRIVLQLLIALGPAASIPGVSGGPIITADGVAAVTTARLTPEVTALISKIMVNKLKLRRMLK